MAVRLREDHVECAAAERGVRDSEAGERPGFGLRRGVYREATVLEIFPKDEHHLALRIDVPQRVLAEDLT